MVFEAQTHSLNSTDDSALVSVHRNRGEAETGMKRSNQGAQARTRRPAPDRAPQSMTVPLDPMGKTILWSLAWAIFIGLAFLAIGWHWTEITNWLYQQFGHAAVAAHHGTSVIASR